MERERHEHGDPSSERACPNDEVLADFVDRRLESARRQGIEDHCHACDACRAIVSHAVFAVTTQSRDGEELEHSAKRPSLPRGTALGRYLVLDEIGRGAMGTVVAAYDPDLDRKVALKILHAALREDAASDPSWRIRMVREARALAAVSHPNIVTIYDVGTWNAHIFIAMELIDGTTLRAWLRARERSPKEVLDVFIAAGKGLAVAHRHGLVHRDFKPDNVLVARDGTVHVSDFGLARFDRGKAEETIADRPRDLGDEDTRNEPAPTHIRGFLGTPAYMSPEQLAGQPADARSDQYSFCIALFEAFAGQRPFAGTTPQALLQARQQPLAWPPSMRTRIAARVRRAIERGLAFAPEQRFASMEALLASLMTPSVRRFGAPTLLGIGLLGGAAAVVAAGPPEDPCATVPAVLDDELLARVERTIAQSDPDEPGLASEIVARVSSRLRERARAFEDAAQRVCRTPSATADVCLQAWRIEFDELVNRLVVADAEVAKAAYGLVQDLTDPSTCLHPRLTPPLPPLLPGGAERQALARQVWLDIAAAGRLLKRGELDASRERLAALQPEIDALDHLPLRAESEMLGCKRLHKERQLEEAKNACLAAARTALAADHRQAFEHVALTLSTLFQQLEDYDRSLEWVDLAEGTREGLGLVSSVPEIAMRRMWIYGSQGRYDEAVAVANAALEALAPDDDLGELMLRANVYSWQLYMGQRDEAIANARWAAARASQVYGETNYYTVVMRTNLAGLLLELGETAEAADLLEQLIASQSTIGDTDSPRLLPLYQSLAVARHEQQRDVEALRAVDRAVAIAGVAAPDADIQHAKLASVRGQILAVLGRHDEAQIAFDLSLRRLESPVVANNHEVPHLIVRAALYLLTRNRHREAASWLRRAEPTALAHEFVTLQAVLAALLADAEAGRNGSSILAVRDASASDPNVDPILEQLVGFHQRLVEAR